MVAKAKKWQWLILLTATLVGLALVWRLTPLSEFLNPQKLFFVMRDFARHSSWAFLAFAVTIAVGNLLMVPINLLLIAVAMVFPGMKGFLCGMLGALLTALLQAHVGRMIGASRARETFGEKFEIISGIIRERGLRAMVVLSLVPVAPNIVVNVVAGICRIPIWKHLIGTMIGFLPGLILLNLMSRELRQFAQDPSLGAALGGVGFLILIYFSATISRHYRSRIEALYDAGAPVDVEPRNNVILLPKRPVLG